MVPFRIGGTLVTLLGAVVAVQSPPLAAPKNGPTQLPASSSGPVCPWFTERSAVTALGGDVRVTLTLATGSQGICTFTKQQTPEDELKIIVGGNNVPSCPPGSTKVVGVGTRANRCRMTGSRGETQEMIAGAVREKNFAVILAMRADTSAASSASSKTDLLQQVAEQVAGNLF
jgi:hypothetical protein